MKIHFDLSYFDINEIQYFKPSKLFYDTMSIGRIRLIKIDELIYAIQYMTTNGIIFYDNWDKNRLNFYIGNDVNEDGYCCKGFFDCFNYSKKGINPIITSENIDYIKLKLKYGM